MILRAAQVVLSVQESLLLTTHIVNLLTTGDIAFRVLKHLSTSRGCKSSSVTVCDINENMLAVGEERWKREGYADLAGANVLNILTGINMNLSPFFWLVCFLSFLFKAARQVNFSWVIGDAMQLPFESNSFDAVTIAFGLRNVTDKQKSLDEMHRVLKRGGALYCLEFSQVDNVILKQFYDLYSFQVLPTLGSAVTGDSDSYRYLVESIRRFPEATALKEMMESAGFNCSSFEKLTGGVVAVHLGFKL